MQVIVQFTINVPEMKNAAKAAEQALATLYTKGAKATITAFDARKIPYRYQSDYPGYKEAKE